MTENDISFQIRGAIFEVYNGLGAGLLESVYQNALELELISRGLFVQKEVPVPVNYKGGIASNVLRLAKKRIQSTKLSVSTELDTKHKASFKNRTRFFAKRLFKRTLPLKAYS